jgi:hypothetical protein
MMMMMIIIGNVDAAEEEMKWTKALKYYAFQMLCDRCDNVTT